jgi:hypothetical protein
MGLAARELRDDLPDHARETEPVPRSAPGDDDVLVLGVEAAEEVLVGSASVIAVAITSLLSRVMLVSGIGTHSRADG